MSATIGNIEDIAKFLNAEVYRKNFRPVELTEYVKCENQIAKINRGYKDENDLLIDAEKLDFKVDKACYFPLSNSLVLSVFVVFRSSIQIGS